jgi:hypothetical protein
MIPADEHEIADMSSAPTKMMTNDDEDEDGEMTCPLFMDCLPPNFASNSGLAAIASLLEGSSDYEDDEDVNDDDTALRQCNDGAENSHQERMRAFPTRRELDKCTRKISSARKCIKFKSKIKDTRKKDKKASVGEVELFLKLWKV